MHVSGRQQTGQATLELTAALLGLLVMILGVVFVAGLCIGNIETFLEAKEDAEEQASANSSGADGREIQNWQYTTYHRGNNEDELEVVIPFLAGDRSSASLYGPLSNSDAGLNGIQYSETFRTALPDYHYLPLQEAPFISVQNRWTATPIRYGASAANLRKGQAQSGEEAVKTLITRRNHAHNQIDAAALHAAFERLTGVRTSQIDLAELPANTVFLPALWIKDE